MRNPRHGRTRPARRSVVGALTLSAALVLAACGGDDPEPAEATGDSESSAPAEPVTVEVGVIPVIDVAVLYLGQEQGIFEEHGITLNFNTGQGGAALVPSLVNGEYDFIFSNVISVMQAREQGLPLTVIAPAAASTGNTDFDINMLMAVDPAIEDSGDLAGRTIGVNTLNNLSEVLARVSVEAAGADPASINLAELPFPDQVTALASGDIDAFVCAEPFCSQAADAGARVVGYPYTDLAEGEQVTAAAYVTSEQAIAEDPELFERLQTALQEAIEYAAENPDEMRAQLANYTQLDPALIETVGLPGLKPTVEPEELRPLADASVRFGILDQEPVLEEVVWSPDN
jgi:NitT/TauT family transport system substrate-binding protein